MLMSLIENPLALLVYVLNLEVLQGLIVNDVLDFHRFGGLDVEVPNRESARPIRKSMSRGSGGFHVRFLLLFIDWYCFSLIWKL